MTVSLACVLIICLIFVSHVVSSTWDDASAAAESFAACGEEYFHARTITAYVAGTENEMPVLHTDTAVDLKFTVDLSACDIFANVFDNFFIKFAGDVDLSATELDVHGPTPEGWGDGPEGWGESLNYTEPRMDFFADVEAKFVRTSHFYAIDLDNYPPSRADLKDMLLPSIPSMAFTIKNVKIGPTVGKVDFSTLIYRDEGMGMRRRSKPVASSMDVELGSYDGTATLALSGDVSEPVKFTRYQSTISIATTATAEELAALGTIEAVSIEAGTALRVQGDQCTINGHAVAGTTATPSDDAVTYSLPIPADVIAGTPLPLTLVCPIAYLTSATKVNVNVMSRKNGKLNASVLASITTPASISTTYADITAVSLDAGGGYYAEEVQYVFSFTHTAGAVLPVELNYTTNYLNLVYNYAGVATITCDGKPVSVYKTVEGNVIMTLLPAYTVVPDTITCAQLYTSTTRPKTPVSSLAAVGLNVAAFATPLLPVLVQGIQKVTITPPSAVYAGTAAQIKVAIKSAAFNDESGQAVFLTLRKSDNDGVSLPVFATSDAIACYLDGTNAKLEASLFDIEDGQALRVEFSHAMVTTLGDSYYYTFSCMLTYARVIDTPVMRLFLATAVDAPLPTHAYKSIVNMPSSLIPYITKDGSFDLSFVSDDTQTGIIADVYHHTFGKSTQFAFTVKSPRFEAWEAPSTVVFTVKTAFVLPSTTCTNKGVISVVSVADPVANTITLTIEPLPNLHEADFTIICTGLRNPTVEEAVAKAIPLNEVVTVVDATLNGEQIPYDTDRNTAMVDISEATIAINAESKAFLSVALPVTFTVTVLNSGTINPSIEAVRYAPRVVDGVFPFASISGCTTAKGGPIAVSKLDNLSAPAVEFAVTTDRFVSVNNQSVLTLTCDVAFSADLDLAKATSLGGYARIFQKTYPEHVPDNTALVHFVELVTSTVEFMSVGAAEVTIVPVTGSTEPMANIYHKTFGKPTQFELKVIAPQPALWTASSKVVFTVTNAVVLESAACVHKVSDISYATTTDVVTNTITATIGTITGKNDFVIVCTGLRNPTLEEVVAKGIAFEQTRVSVSVAIDGTHIEPEDDESFGLQVSEFTTVISSDRRAVLNTATPVTFTFTAPNVDAVHVSDAIVPLRLALTASVFPFNGITACATATGTDVTVRKLETLSTRAVEFDINKNMFTAGEGKQIILAVTCAVTFDPTLDITVPNPLAGYARIFAESVSGEVADNEPTMHFATTTTSTLQYLIKDAPIVKMSLTINGLAASLPDNALAALATVVSNKVSALVKAVPTPLSVPGFFVAADGTTTCSVVQNTVTETPTAALPVYSNALTIDCPVESQAIASSVATAAESEKAAYALAFANSILPWGTPTTTLSIDAIEAATQDNTCFNGAIDASNNESDIDCGGQCPLCTADKKCTNDSDCIQTCDEATKTCVGVEREGDNGAAHVTVGVAIVAMLVATLFM